jgi:Sulfotransferase domain
MLRQLATVAKFVLQPDIAGPHFAGDPGDTFIASHPRSGNTWIRALITALIHPDKPLTFDLMERTVWDTTAQSIRVLRKAPRPRLVKVHQSFDPRLKKVVYVVRDPRDVALSYYHFQRKYRYLDDEYPIERFVRRFVAGEASGDYGSWGEHVGSWLGARFPSLSFLLVRYEDLKAHPARELSRIASFSGIETGGIAEAVERCSVERLRHQEAREQESWVATRRRRMDIPFFGPAEAGRWKESMSKTCVALIEGAWAPIMKALGYELTEVEPDPPPPTFLSRAAPLRGCGAASSGATRRPNERISD